MSLNGTSNYAEVPSSSSLNISGNITIEAWVKVNSIGVYQDILTRESWGQAGTGGGYELSVTNLGKPRLDFYQGPSQYTTVIGATTMSTGTWYHVAGVFDGSQMRIYLNGALDGTFSTTSGPATGTSNVRIGKTSLGSYFGGLVDEARISNTAVYTGNFTPATSLTAIGSTKGLWKFDGQMLNDSSGNANNGTLVSGTYSTDVPGGSGGTAQNVSWMGAVNVTVNGNSITKSSPAAWDGGANSSQSIVSGDGYVEMTITETNKDRFFGLSDSETTVTSGDIDFSVRAYSNGVVYCYEPGTNGAFCSYYQSGQKLRVAVESGVVRYYIIDGNTTTLMYTANTAPTYPLSADGALYENGATITNAVISGNLNSGGGTSAQINWLVTDQLGTPRMIIDETGTLANVKRHDYLPFGEELYAGVGGRTTAQGYIADTVRQKFTAKERDNETGLDFFEARYFSSTQGRFSSVDPILTFAVTQLPQSWNRYAYVMNNPLVLIDPTGELWIAADDKGTQYNWVDKCPEGGTCYESIAVASDASVLIYGSRDQNDLTWALANKNGLVDVAAMANHPDAQFESASGPSYDPETYLNTTNAAALFNVARMYHDANPNDAELVFTGASNSKGQSALDANGAPIHGTHRNGENIDMRYMDVNGRPIKASNASSLADPRRMASLLGAFGNQTQGLANVYTGDQKRLGLPAISKKLEKQHRNHFHLYQKK